MLIYDQFPYNLVLALKGKNMNDGVKILLERMKTNPEEFIGEAGFAYSKWGSLIGAYKEHLNLEDRTVLTDAL